MGGMVLKSMSHATGLMGIAEIPCVSYAFTKRPGGSCIGEENGENDYANAFHLLPYGFIILYSFTRAQSKTA